ncbi:protein NirH [Gemmobacter lanyuensis]|uniref:siroheme decarboxylase n=1 Tax=Gemmobacter lanyuensis TaxID=1054497 RepID=A0A918J1K3_9RHOB|nr:AsnC family transcriptional regulator [Gemmobacter lanyuensis]GGW43152.1 protein NirH [Gemmobacter lanyuensis]
MIPDATDRRLLAATASGLPLTPAPFAEIAGWLGLSEDEVIARLRGLQEAGIIRRIAAAPNHYALGMTANGMSVWDVADEAVDRLGERVGALPFVSHCYRRPRALPGWPYNLFAMIHGSSRDEVQQKRTEIAALLGDACRGHDILYSTRILKKTGMRLAEGG